MSSDTGVGVAPEDQDAILDEFRQVGTADKKAEGSGLGRTLCRKFIELLGGRMWRGTTEGLLCRLPTSKLWHRAPGAVRFEGWGAIYAVTQGVPADHQSQDC